MTEAKVFTDKLAALRYVRGTTSKFYETWCVLDEATETKNKPLYVVAASEHQARLALVDFLMPLKKWNAKQQDREYIAALEAEADRNGSEAQDET